MSEQINLATLLFTKPGQYRALPLGSVQQGGRSRDRGCGHRLMVRTDREIVAIDGTGSGADTAAVITQANSHTCLDLKVHEVICKPRLSIPLEGANGTYSSGQPLAAVRFKKEKKSCWTFEAAAGQIGR